MDKPTPYLERLVQGLISLVLRHYEKLSACPFIYCDQSVSMLDSKDHLVVGLSYQRPKDIDATHLQFAIPINRSIKTEPSYALVTTSYDWPNYTIDTTSDNVYVDIGFLMEVVGDALAIETPRDHVTVKVKPDQEIPVHDLTVFQTYLYDTNDCDPSVMAITDVSTDTRIGFHHQVQATINAWAKVAPAFKDACTKHQCTHGNLMSHLNIFNYEEVIKFSQGNEHAPQ